MINIEELLKAIHAIVAADDMTDTERVSSIYEIVSDEIEARKISL